jgi:hypothetical protein
MNPTAPESGQLADQPSQMGAGITAQALHVSKVRISVIADAENSVIIDGVSV